VEEALDVVNVMYLSYHGRSHQLKRKLDRVLLSVIALKASTIIQWRTDQNQRSNSEARYVVNDEELRDALRGQECVDLRINGEYRRIDVDEISPLLGCGVFSRISLQSQVVTWKIRDLTIGTMIIRNTKGASIKDVLCGRLEISEVSGPLEIENCQVAELVIGYSSEARQENTIIKNCFIGCIDFLTDVGGKDFFVERVDLFRGPYSDEQLGWFSSLNDKSPRSNRASLSKLVAFSKSVGNSHTVTFARAEELARDQLDAVGASRAFLWLWGKLSDYGKDAMLPLCWLVLSSSISFVVLLNTSTILRVSDSAALGWQKVLAEPSSSFAEIGRAFVGTFESVFSPLSVLGLRSLVVAETVFGAAICLTHGYFSLLCILLFGAALRRRLRSYE
jgi:hypothetical protein